MESNVSAVRREPWNKGRIVGQKALFKLKAIWTLRIRLQMESRVRELALFNLGIDGKLRGCDLVALKVRDVCHGDQVATRDRDAAQDAAARAVRDHPRQYARILGGWVHALGMDPADYGTHSLRRTKATLMPALPQLQLGSKVGPSVMPLCAMPHRPCAAEKIEATLTAPWAACPLQTAPRVD